MANTSKARAKVQEEEEEVEKTTYEGGSISLFIPITKVNADQRMVYGVLAKEEPDKSGEIFDFETSRPYVEAWSNNFAQKTGGKSMGNLRAMHQKIAAGKFTEVECNPLTRQVEVAAKVVDDNEWNKVLEGVYTGFSIGGSYVNKWRDAATGLRRYTVNPDEGSLADNPCAPGATFTVVKADGSQEVRKFAGSESSQSQNRTEVEKVANQTLEDVMDSAGIENGGTVPSIDPADEADAVAENKANQPVVTPPAHNPGNGNTDATKTVQVEVEVPAWAAKLAEAIGALDSDVKTLAEKVAAAEVAKADNSGEAIDGVTTKPGNVHDPEGNDEGEGEAQKDDGGGDAEMVAGKATASDMDDAQDSDEDTGPGEQADGDPLNPDAPARSHDDAQGGVGGVGSAGKVADGGMVEKLAIAEKVANDAKEEVQKAWDVVREQGTEIEKVSTIVEGQREELAKATGLLDQLKGQIERLEKAMDEPLNNGPILNAAAYLQARGAAPVNKTLMHDAAMLTGMEITPDLERQVLQKVFDGTSDPAQKVAIGRELSLYAIKAVHEQGAR